MSAEYTQSEIFDEDNRRWSPWTRTDELTAMLGYKDRYIGRLVRESGADVVMHRNRLIERRAVKKGEDFGNCKFVVRCTLLQGEVLEAGGIKQAPETTDLTKTEQGDVPRSIVSYSPPSVELPEETDADKLRQYLGDVILALDISGEDFNDKLKNPWKILYRRYRLPMGSGASRRDGVDLEALRRHEEASRGKKFKSTIAFAEWLDETTGSQHCAHLYAIALRIWKGAL